MTIKLCKQSLSQLSQLLQLLQLYRLYRVLLVSSRKPVIEHQHSSGFIRVHRDSSGLHASAFIRVAPRAGQAPPLLCTISHFSIHQHSSGFIRVAPRAGQAPPLLRTISRFGIHQHSSGLHPGRGKPRPYYARFHASAFIRVAFAPFLFLHD